MDIADTHQLAVAAGRSQFEPDVLFGIDDSLCIRVVDEIIGIIFPIHQLVYALICQFDDFISCLCGLLAQLGIIFGHPSLHIGRQRTCRIEIRPGFECKGGTFGHTPQISIRSGHTLFCLIPVNRQTGRSLIQVLDDPHEGLLE